MSSNKIRAEILAPAGNYECFLAAINAGADAVYLGGNMFGARAFAGNFSDEELVNAINYAHLFNRRVYLTVNTLLRNEEILKLSDYIRPFYEAGLDAVIVQDFGVFSILRKEFPDLPLHASTQMSIMGPYGAKMLKSMGATRVVTARELSAAEIRDIHDQVDVEIESFVHGALCYSYSGQCLLSSMIGGRSGNRGRCAQPCRLKYSCNGINDKHLLSPKDMCTLEAIPDIIEAGVFSLKIEGRMKSPEYVAGVTAAYRKYVDMYFNKGREGFKVDPKDIFVLMDLYNRGGFCKGYYYKQNDKNMMTFDRPNHQGVLVGKIKNNTIVLSNDVYSGDVLELNDGQEYTIPNDFSKGKSINIPSFKGFKSKNDYEVFRTRNASLLNRIRKEHIENNIKIPISINASFLVGQVPYISIMVKSDATGDLSVYISGEAIIEESLNRPATYEDIVGKLEKLGNTPFVTTRDDIDIAMSENAFVPVKVINELRRMACDELMGKLCMNTINTNAQVNGSEECLISTKNELDPSAKITCAMVMKEEQLDVILAEFCDSFDRIYACTDMAGITGAVNMCKKIHNGSNMECYLVMPYIFRKRGSTLWDKNIEAIKEAGFDGIMLRSPEQFEYMVKTGLDKLFDGHIMADYNLYTYNSAAFAAFDKKGINGYTLSEELNSKQLLRLMDSVDGQNRFVEKIVYGYLPLMITAGCTLSYTSNNSPCNNPSVYKLKDRTGKDMAAINCCPYCYNLVLNNTPEYLVDKETELAKMGVNSYRYMFTIEDGAQVRDIISNGITEYTRGHYNRGVD